MLSPPEYDIDVFQEKRGRHVTLGLVRLKNPLTLNYWTNLILHLHSFRSRLFSTIIESTFLIEKDALVALFE